MNNPKNDFINLKNKLDNEKELREESDRKLQLEVRIAQSNITTKLFKVMTFDKFDVNKIKCGKEILDGVRKFSTENYNNNGDLPYFYTLYGNVGLGKSHLAMASAGEVVKYNSAIYWHTPALLQYLRKCDFDKTIFDVMDVLTDVYYLVIDDYGDFKVTEYKTELLDIIINSRYDHDKLTMVTTNFDFMNLCKVNPRIASRLMSGYYSKFEGEDYRVENLKLRRIGN